MIRILLTVFLSWTVIVMGTAQHLIGLKKADLMKTMRETQKTFMLDGSTRNENFRYIKYVDQINEETLYCMLSDNDVCVSTRLISDYANLDQTVNRLNKDYRRINCQTWSYKVGKSTYIITLAKAEWFFTLTTKKRD